MSGDPAPWSTAVALPVLLGHLLAAPAETLALKLQGGKPQTFAGSSEWEYETIRMEAESTGFERQEARVEYFLTVTPTEAEFFDIRGKIRLEDIFRRTDIEWEGGEIVYIRDGETVLDTLGGVRAEEGRRLLAYLGGKPQKFRLQLDSTGRVKKASARPEILRWQLFGTGGFFFPFLLPEKPVPPGGAWEVSMEPTGFGLWRPSEKLKPETMKFRWEKTEERGGIRLAKISGEAEADLPPLRLLVESDFRRGLYSYRLGRGKLKIQTETWLELKTGRLESTEWKYFLEGWIEGKSTLYVGEPTIGVGWEAVDTETIASKFRLQLTGNLKRE